MATVNQTLEAEDPIAALRVRLLNSEGAVPTSGWRRLWRGGRSAAGLARLVLGGRRDAEDGFSAEEREALSQLVQRLGELKGVAMKAGQILGYIDPTLPAELRRSLSLLQTAAPATPFARVEATVREALGSRAEVLLAGLTRAPVAVASIGQVHRGRLPDGTEIAVKVRHPGVAEALRSDFQTAGAGAAFAGLLTSSSGVTVRGFFSEARDAVLAECDFVLEAQHQARFHRLYQEDPTLVIPAVVEDLCGASVLTTHWEPGRGLDAFLAGAPHQRHCDRLGGALFSFYVGALYQHGLFHADPHPGNYAVRDDGRLVVYDFGCVRTFPRPAVAALARLLAAVRADERAAVFRALVDLGAHPPKSDSAYEHLRALLRGFFAPLLQSGPQPMDPGAGLAGGALLRDKKALLDLGLPGTLLFLFRLRFGLYAVLARLGAVADWAALEGAWASEVLGTSTYPRT